MPLVSFLISIVFLHPWSADADVNKGRFRIQGAECSLFKGLSPVGSILAQIDENHKATVFLYNGPRHPLDYTKGLLASGEGTAHRMKAFPDHQHETVVINLQEDLARSAERPRLVLTSKIIDPSQLPSNGYLSNPFTEDDNIQYRCEMRLEEITETKDDISNYLYPATHPSLCTIEFRDPSRSKPWTHGCTASVFSSTQLITAAHCAESFQSMELRVRCGDDLTYHKVSSWISNPDFRPPHFEVSKAHDISILTLTEKINAPSLKVELNPALSRKFILENKNCKHYGMGQRADGSIGKLYESPYSFPPLSLGGKDFVEQIFMLSNMIASDPSHFMRWGDSGGPIVCDNADKEEVIVGIHSFISVASSSALSAITAESGEFINSQYKESVFLGQ